MQTWFNRQPQAARAIITAAWVFAAIFGVTQLYALDARSDMFYHSVIARLVVAAVSGLLVGVIAVVSGDRRIRRIYGSTEQAIAYSSALRTGQLPTDIQPAAWQRWLDVSHRSYRWTPWAVPAYAVLAGVQSLGHHQLLASLFALLAIWLLAVRKVMHRRIARLATAVAQRAEAVG
jgi:hypothetical protein